MIRKYELWTLLLSRLSSNIYLGFDSSAAQYPICIHPHLLSLTKLPLVTQEKAIASRKRMATWSPLATLIVNTHSYFLPQYTRQPWAGSTILCRWVQNVLYHLPEHKILLHLVSPPQMGWPPPGQASCSSSQVGAYSHLLIFQLFSSCDLPMYYVSQSCPKVVSN